MKRRSLLRSVPAMAAFAALPAAVRAAENDGPPDKVTKWTFQPAFDSSDAGWDRGLIPWVKAVEEATEGTVKIRVEPVGALTTGSEAFSACAAGMTDGYAGWATVYGGELPEGYLAYGMAMGASSPEEAWAAMWGDPKYRIGDIVQEAAHRIGLHWVGWTDQGPNSMFTNFPIRKLEDLKGKKMRAGGPQALFHKAMGGAPVSMDAGDIYTAIKLGTIEGTYWDTGGIADMHFEEVIKYASQPGWCPAQHQETYVNLKKWNELTPWQQKKIEGLFEPLYFETSKLHLEAADGALQTLKDAGGEVITMSDEEVQRMRDKSVSEVWPDVAKLSKGNAEGVKLWEQYFKDRA